MLLMTYQNLPDEFWRNPRGWDHGRMVDAVAGYARDASVGSDGAESPAIWCVAAGSPKQAVMQSILCEPVEPAVAMFVDTDDFMRVDKVEWYRRIRDEECPEIPFSDCVDDDHSEFIVSGEAFRRDALNTMALLLPFGSDRIDGAADFIRGTGSMLPAQLAGNREYMDALLESIAPALGTLDGMMTTVLNGEDGASAAQVALRRGKFLFEYSHLAPLVSCAMGESELRRNGGNGVEVRMDLAIPLSMAGCPTSIMSVVNRFGRWADCDADHCSLAGFDAILHELDMSLIEDVELADTLNAGGIGRNDPCPCGSGRKYKKCHGPYFG